MDKLSCVWRTLPYFDGP